MRQAAEAQRAADVTLSFELPPTSEPARLAKATRAGRPGEPD
jgi:hypothetical protein